jgi:NADH dehydrogenase
MPKYPEVMVIGDLAAVIEGNGPHPQTAQAAFEQAKLAAENIHALCHQQPLKAFYFRYKGELVPIGNYFAIGEIFGFSVPGFLGWLIRRAVYLEGLFSWRDRFHVFGDWISALWEPRDTEHL